MIKQNLTFYKGIDYLTIGIYTNPTDPEKYDEKIYKLKEKLLENNREIKISSFKFKVETKKEIYPYQLFLTYTPKNEKKHQISIYLALHPFEEKIQKVRNFNIVDTPDILVEITGKALRPQNLRRTQNIINEILKFLNANAYAFIYSRIDYCVDIYDPIKSLNFEEHIKPIVDKAKKMIKTQTKYKEKIGIEGIEEIEIKEVSLYEEIVNYKKGTSGYKEFSAYKTNDRDPELLAIYKQHADIYNVHLNLEFITRLEIRTWRDSLKRINHSLINIRLINNYIDIENILSDATGVIYETGLPDEFIELAKKPTPIFKYTSQITNKVKERLKIKEIKKVDPTINELIKGLLGYVKAIKNRIEILAGKEISAEQTINFILDKLKEKEFIKYLYKKYEETSDNFYMSLKQMLKSPNIKTLLLQQNKNKIRTPVVPETDISKDKFFKNLDPPDDLIIDF